MGDAQEPEVVSQTDLTLEQRIEELPEPQRAALDKLFAPIAEGRRFIHSLNAQSQDGITLPAPYVYASDEKLRSAAVQAALDRLSAVNDLKGHLYIKLSDVVQQLGEGVEIGESKVREGLASYAENLSDMACNYTGIGVDDRALVAAFRTAAEGLGGLGIGCELPNLAMSLPEKQATRQLGDGGGSDERGR